MQGNKITNPLKWQAESLRFTAFAAKGATIQSFKRWREMFGEPPEEGHFLKVPKIMVESGPFEDKQLIFQIMNPLRFDWNLAYRPDETTDLDEIKMVHIGPFNQALISFKELIERWIDGCGSLQRIAFGAVLISPVSNRVEGYKAIQDYLPSVTLDPDGSLDFLYQINRRRPSLVGIDGLWANRLSKWSIAHLFPSHQASKITENPQDIEPGVFACRLEMDVNTVPDFPQPLPSEKVNSIFSKLIDLSVEIAENGDVP